MTWSYLFYSNKPYLIQNISQSIPLSHFTLTRILSSTLSPYWKSSHKSILPYYTHIKCHPLSIKWAKIKKKDVFHRKVQPKKRAHNTKDGRDNNFMNAKHFCLKPRWPVKKPKPTKKNFLLWILSITGPPLALSHWATIKSNSLEEWWGHTI